MALPSIFGSAIVLSHLEPLSGFRYQDSFILYFLPGNTAERIGEFIGRYSRQRVVVVNVYFADVGCFDATFVNEKTKNVAFREFLLLSGIEI